MPLENFNFSLVGWVLNENLEEKSILLGFRERISAFKIDRVLSCKDQERGWQRVRLTVNRNPALFHCL